jgi:hypothetical protein
MNESNDSDSVESVDETDSKRGTELDKTDSGDGRTKAKACNLVSPPSNERDNALDPGTVGERAKMTDVYCINVSVADDLYGRISAVQSKGGRAFYKKVVAAYESSVQRCFAEFPLTFFANWYSKLPRILDVVQAVEYAGDYHVWEYKVLMLHPSKVKEDTPQMKTKYEEGKKLGSAF